MTKRFFKSLLFLVSGLTVFYAIYSFNLVKPVALVCVGLFIGFMIFGE